MHSIHHISQVNELVQDLLKPPEAKPKLDNIVLTKEQEEAIDAALDASDTPPEVKENLIAAMRDINMAARGSQKRSTGPGTRGRGRGRGDRSSKSTTGFSTLPPKCSGCGGCHV